MPILECLKLCRINSSRKAVSENWLSHTTVGSCNNSRFAFLLLTNDLDLHFSILVETHMRKIGGLIFLHSSRVFEFYPFQQYKAECPIWYISYFLHFVSFILLVSPRKTELCLKPSLGYIWLSSSYYMAEVWYEQSEVHGHCELMQPISSLTVLLQRHPEVPASSDVFETLHFITLLAFF